MSNLNEENIKFLSQLCRIEINEEELQSLLTDLKRVVEYVGQLQEIKLGELAPYSHLEEQGIDVLRQDIAQDTLSRTSFLANAPEHVGGMIRVPPIMKQSN